MGAKCLWFGSANISTTGTQYLAAMGRSSAALTAEAFTLIPIAVPGTFRNFRVKLPAAPGSGVTRTFTVRKNAVDTALVVAITGTSQTLGSDTSNSIAFAAGDTISIKHVVSGGTAAAADLGGFTLEFEGDSTAIALGGCAAAGVGFGSDKFIALMGRTAEGTTIATASSRTTKSYFHCPGTITDFCYRLNFSSRAFSGTCNEQIRKNGSAEASSALSVASGTGVKTNSVGSLSIAVAAGDDLEIMHDLVSGTDTGTTTEYGWGFGFVPTNDGEFPICSNSGANNSAVNYAIFGANYVGATTQPTEVFHPVSAIEILGGRADLTAALTGSQTWDGQLQKNDANGNGAISLVSGETSDTYTATDSFADDDLLSWSWTDTNNPTSAPIRMGLTGKYAASGPTQVPLTGSLPAMSGVVVDTQLVAPTGVLPAQSGVLQLAASIALRGNLPSQSGLVQVTMFDAPAGVLPAMSGVVAFSAIYNAAVAGNLPAMSGAVDFLQSVSLAGNLPAMSGALQLAAAIALAGNLPAQSGAVSAGQAFTVTGVLPAQSGLLQLAATIATRGNLPAMAGNLDWDAFIALAGVLPAQSGAIDFAQRITLAGNLPAQSGALDWDALIHVLGSLPAMVGTLGIDATIALLGSLPSQSGLVAFSQSSSLAGVLPAQSGLVYATPVIEDQSHRRKVRMLDGRRR